MKRTRRFLAGLGTATLLLCAPVHAAPVPLYQTYNAQYQDYFYTIDLNERNLALTYGYVDLGIAARVESAQAANTAPFWRFYKGLPQTDHFYTTDPAEYNVVTSYGWQYERVEGYLFTAQAPGTQPLYRYNHWEGATSDLMHFYTVDATTRSALEAAGWVLDGVAGYVYPATPPAPIAQICVDGRTGAPVLAESDGTVNVAQKINTCLGYGVLTNGVWEMPKGIYAIGRPIDSARGNMTWRTAGTQNAPGCPYTDATASSCAILRAHPGLDANLPPQHPMIQIVHPGFVMDHLIVDGNRSSRPQSCPPGTNYRGTNAYFTSGATDSQFTGNVTRNALCGSGFVVDADRVTIAGNYFYQNGVNSPNLWADGLTLTNCGNCVVSNNTLIDNTDVQMVMGNGQNTQIMNNLFQSSTRSAFAAFALDNFNQTALGNFDGTLVQGNTIHCAGLCNIGMNIGAHAWYQDGGNVKGGAILYNFVHDAKVGVLIDGAGIPGRPTSVFGNTVSGSPACGTPVAFSCGMRRTCNWVYNDRNYGHQGDSEVELNGENGALYPGAYGESWHGCH